MFSQIACIEPHRYDIEMDPCVIPWCIIQSTSKIMDKISH